MPIPVELDVRTDGRLPQRIEATAYFVISEALTNAVKHSGASVVRVGVEGDRETVRVSIDDDGVGGANAARGSGLVGLRDRVEALGGRLTLRSAPGEGTQLVAELPLQLEAQDLPADDAVRVQVAVRPDREAR
jgi:signal transduction histidine kinase